MPPALRDHAGAARGGSIAAGRQIVIMPEGTRRAPDDPPDYKPGAAALYGTLGVPCVPFALNSGLFWPRRKFLRHPGTIVIEFLPADSRRACRASDFQRRLANSDRRPRPQGWWPKARQWYKTVEQILDSLGSWRVTRTPWTRCPPSLDPICPGNLGHEVPAQGRRRHRHRPDRSRTPGGAWPAPWPRPRHPTQRAAWAERFLRACSRIIASCPPGRILAGAGTGRTVTLFNCFVMGTHRRFAWPAFSTA